MSQLALFAEPRARHDNPATSHAAAAMVRNGSAETEIMDAFKRSGAPLTDDELAGLLPHRNPMSLRSARGRLTKLGHLVPTSDTRPGRCGAQMTVWRLP